MAGLRLCALVAAVAAFTTSPPQRQTTAVQGVRGALLQKARGFPIRGFEKESRPGQLLERLGMGRELSPFPPRGDGSALLAQQAVELETCDDDEATVVESVKTNYYALGSSTAESSAHAAVAALRSEGRRLLDETAEEKAAREAAWLAASEVEAAEAAAEDEKRARRAQLERMWKAKDSEQAAREAAWRTASVANLEQLQLEKGATPMANNDEEAGLRAEIDRILEREAALRSESERFSFEEEKAAELALENLERERLAEEKAAQLKAEQEALVAAEEAKREAALTARR